MANVIIFGIGRGASVAYRYLVNDSPHNIVAFTVEKEFLVDSSYHGLPVISTEEIEKKFPPSSYKAFVPMGFQNMNKLRYEKYKLLKSKGYSFISYIHSSNRFIEPPQIGENCFILENQTINLDVKIGNNVTIWSCNQIGDNTVIQDNCWISSHVCIAGNVTIKPFTIIGINAAISHNITIEQENFIGANALIAKNTAPQDVYIIEQPAKAPFSSDRFIHIIHQP